MGKLITDIENLNSIQKDILFVLIDYYAQKFIQNDPLLGKPAEVRYAILGLLDKGVFKIVFHEETDYITIEPAWEIK